MTEETAPKNVTEALARIMSELGGIGKDRQAAAQQGGYAYRGIEDITVKVQPLLAKYGVVFFPQGEITEIRDITVNGKPWSDTLVSVVYEVSHGPSDTSKTIKVPGIGRDNSDKGSNKGMTQAYKYALIQSLCISDPKDDGDRESHEAEGHGTVQHVARPRSNGNGASTHTPDEISAAQLKFLNNLLYRTGHDLTMLTDLIGREVVSPPYLTKPEATKVIDHLKAISDALPPSDAAPTVNEVPKGLPNNILRQVAQAMRDANVLGPEFVQTAIKVIERDITGLEEMTPTEATKVVAAMQEMAS